VPNVQVAPEKSKSEVEMTSGEEPDVGVGIVDEAAANGTADGEGDVAECPGDAVC
jgi:hypothetical protein